MSTISASFDPWGQTVSLLSMLSAGVASPGWPPRSTGQRVTDWRPVEFVHGAVSVVERLSPLTAAITWHDPTMCNYESQTWRTGVAKGTGRCAITGDPISPGDEIYRPIDRRPVAANALAMVRACAVKEALGELDGLQQG